MSARHAYYAPVPVPEFLLIDDSYADVQAFITLVKRIGLINPVRPVATQDAARAYLRACASSALPVVIFSEDPVSEDEDGVGAWIQQQEPPIAAIPSVLLQKPLEMYAVIGSLKALALPERARIDTTTLTVRVELWPYGTILADA
jgi:hypothetical protein